jgi:hypothetical protein
VAGFDGGGVVADGVWAGGFGEGEGEGGVICVGGEGGEFDAWVCGVLGRQSPLYRVESFIAGFLLRDQTWLKFPSDACCRKEAYGRLNVDYTVRMK